MRKKILVGFAFLFYFLVGCSVTPANEEPVISETVVVTKGIPTTTPIPKSSPKITQKPTMTPMILTESMTVAPLPNDQATPTPKATLGPDEWKQLPIVPESISDSVREIYLRGLSIGNNPQAFSKVGDCGSTPAWFLGDFDRDDRYYSLGSYNNLQDVIDYFQGSFSRTSLAAKSGMNASSAFVTFWADKQYCEPGELPIACEYRIHQPGFVFIMLGTNDVWHPDRFEPQMRKLIEYYIENGVVPILSTKADNLEKDGSINATIARLAQEYEIPLWNYWAAVQDLPNGGLQEDGAHLTYGRSFFDDPDTMKNAWPVRNLTALQMLDAVWRTVSVDPEG